MPEYVVDFSEFSKIVDELLSKRKVNPDPEIKSDMINKYKQLYEASIKIEDLKNKRAETIKYIDAYNVQLKSINSQIDELNKLFSN